MNKNIIEPSLQGTKQSPNYMGLSMSGIASRLAMTGVLNIEVKNITDNQWFTSTSL